jgi:hypothetical protein
MLFATIQALIGWAFQMECVSGAKVQKFGDTQEPAFGLMSFSDLKAQSAMVMAKVGRLPYDERAALWAIHLQRDTEIMYLAAKMPGKYGLTTDLELVRKWATSEGPSCRELGKRHNFSYVTLHRYEADVFRQLDLLMHAAYKTLERQSYELLECCLYSDKAKEAGVSLCLVC